ncbi:uncharacterized protein LOC129803772 [Phlebotomus papatasi]|nr:uncharacterized protein LOC129803772 [Phlebotomus papatasi]
MADNKENNKDADDEIPEDFFDDFSNTEFMAGLDVIDTWDEGEENKEKKSRPAKKPAEDGDEGRERKRHRQRSPPGRDRRNTRSKSPVGRAPWDSPEKRRRHSPPPRRHERNSIPRRDEFRRPGGSRRSRSRSRSRSPRSRRRSPPKNKTPFLEELAQKLAEKGHSLTGLQPNPYAFQAQNYPNYQEMGYGGYPVRAPGPMVMPYQQMPLVQYPNLPQYQAPPVEYPGHPGAPGPWPAGPPQPNNFNSTLSINLTQQTAAPSVQTNAIPGANPEPPERAKTPQQEKFQLGLAQMLEDNYEEVKEKIAELSSKDSILVRCKKAIDSLRGDSKTSNAFIYVPMTMPKETADGSPVGKFHHVKFPWSGKCEIDTHFITLSSSKTREVAQKLGMSAAKIINKLKIQDVTEKMSNNTSQAASDMALVPENYSTTACQTDPAECPTCLKRELLTYWDSAAQTEPVPPTPSVADVLPDYDESSINLLRRFGQQQRDILIYFMRLIERPDYVTPYHINTLTSRLQDLPRISNQARQVTQPSGYLINPQPDFRRF